MIKNIDIAIWDVFDEELTIEEHNGYPQVQAEFAFKILGHANGHMKL